MTSFFLLPSCQLDLMELAEDWRQSRGSSRATTVLLVRGGQMDMLTQRAYSPSDCSNVFCYFLFLCRDLDVIGVLDFMG